MHTQEKVKKLLREENKIIKVKRRGEILSFGENLFEVIETRRGGKKLLS